MLLEEPPLLGVRLQQVVAEGSRANDRPRLECGDGGRNYLPLIVLRRLKKVFSRLVVVKTAECKPEAGLEVGFPLGLGL